MSETVTSTDMPETAALAAPDPSPANAAEGIAQSADQEPAAASDDAPVPQTAPPSGPSRPKHGPKHGPTGTGAGAGAGTGAGRSDAPHNGIGAQDSTAINANLAGLAAGTVRLVG